MKIKVEIDEKLAEEEIILRCRELNEETIAIQKRLAGAVNEGMKLSVMRGELEYYLDLQEILFFETAGAVVAVHTVSQIYETHLRLYELEEMLPGNFLRVSKSAILNTGRIRSVRKNITGASEVEFDGTGKKAFVSRSYFKLLTNKLEEKRLKK
ncbi:MAG: LytTR family transcriptional regulator [Lachnospiraceae bacterium]|nr:LytTR family transcriptional regulator [Lachnospiraceae bacterium]